MKTQTTNNKIYYETKNFSVRKDGIFEVCLESEVIAKRFDLHDAIKKADEFQKTFDENF